MSNSKVGESALGSSAITQRIWSSCSHKSTMWYWPNDDDSRQTLYTTFDFREQGGNQKFI